MKLCAKRLITAAVLAAYLVVGTLGGLLHQHEHGECCSAPRQVKSHCPFHNCRHHHHEQDRDQPARTPFDDDCAACQLVAQSSLASPTVEAPQAAELISFLTISPPESPAAVIALAWQSRGPPSLG